MFSHAKWASCAFKDKFHRYIFELLKVKFIIEHTYPAAAYQMIRHPDH